MSGMNKYKKASRTKRKKEQASPSIKTAGYKNNPWHYGWVTYQHLIIIKLRKEQPPRDSAYSIELNNRKREVLDYLKTIKKMLVEGKELNSSEVPEPPSGLKDKKRTREQCEAEFERLWAYVDFIPQATRPESSTREFNSPSGQDISVESLHLEDPNYLPSTSTPKRSKRKA
jgi:hypothetical protein